MTIEEIKELLRIFNESGVAELELQRVENRLRLRRAELTREYILPGASQPGATLGAASPVPYPPPSTSASPPAPTAPARPLEGEHIQTSPIVGTYYDAPAPDAAPFVRVGDSVDVGQVLCIIESMKLMNEIEAEVAGVVTAKLVENGRPVEYGEALIALRAR